MKKDIIVAPRRCHTAILPRACTETGEPGLLSLPENFGFKCWVKGRPGIWEHGKTETEAIDKMLTTLPCWGMSLGKIIHQASCTN